MNINFASQGAVNISIFNFQDIMNLKYAFKPNLGFKIIEITLLPKQNSSAIQTNIMQPEFSIKASENLGQLFYEVSLLKVLPFF